MIRVLFLARPDLFKIKAGDTVQIKNLQSSLEKLGVKIDLSLDMSIDLKPYDFVHCFNILRVEVSLPRCRWVKNANKPLIVTPIYWNMREYLSHQQKNLLSRWEAGQRSRKKLLKLVDLLAPNAREEWKRIKKDFNLELPYRVIYNGVNPYFYVSDNNQREGIYSAGRIHRRKNQLNLLEALQGIDIPVFIIGNVNDPNYYRQCQQAAGKRVKFIEGVSRKKLSLYFRKARVHVLPSWYDTPGLVNLEAGLAGCTLVTTNRGTAREYLGDMAFYCSPDNPGEIRTKVLKAYQSPPSTKLAQHILKNFTWDKIAQKTIAIYHEFLDGIAPA